MADEQDDAQKTEQPTAKRLEEARKRGQAVTSREINNLFLIGTLAFILAWLLPAMVTDTNPLLLPFLADADQIPTDAHGLGIVMTALIKQVAMILLLPLTMAAFAAFAAGFIQHGGLVFSGETIQPRWDKLSLSKGLSRMFSLRALTELLKGIFKILVVGTVAWKAVSPHLTRMRQLPDADMHAMLVLLALLTQRIMIGVLVALFFMAILDYFYQRYEFIKSLRMSKQEIKDEYKQQEGDPIIKQRLRALRMERARRRMMAAIPTADVVITNPTHFAVALKYDSATMPAPKVVAKGIDFLALAIRRVAEEKGIPVIENPPIAQALYKTTKIDEEIPLAHYKAVAEIIAYVYKLKGKKFGK